MGRRAWEEIQNLELGWFVLLGENVTELSIWAELGKTKFPVHRECVKTEEAGYKTLQHCCETVLFYCVWISCLAGKKPSPFCRSSEPGQWKRNIFLEWYKELGKKP